jgi:predicted nuclease of predicted toxin-antitoxin system
VKLLVDVGVGSAVEAWLQAQGHDVLSVRNLDPRMPDDDILALAARDARLVVTMDRDFGELVYRLGQGHSGVLLLRLEDADSGTKVAVVQEIFNNHERELARRFSVYQRGTLRVRG